MRNFLKRLPLPRIFCFLPKLRSRLKSNVSGLKAFPGHGCFAPHRQRCIYAERRGRRIFPLHRRAFALFLTPCQEKSESDHGGGGGGGGDYFDSGKAKNFCKFFSPLARGRGSSRAGFLDGRSEFSHRNNFSGMFSHDCRTVSRYSYENRFMRETFSPNLLE